MTLVELGDLMEEENKDDGVGDPIKLLLEEVLT